MLSCVRCSVEIEIPDEDAIVRSTRRSPQQIMVREAIGSCLRRVVIVVAVPQFLPVLLAPETWRPHARPDLDRHKRRVIRGAGLVRIYCCNVVKPSVAINATAVELAL